MAGSRGNCLFMRPAVTANHYTIRVYSILFANPCWNNISSFMGTQGFARRTYQFNTFFFRGRSIIGRCAMEFFS
jgi:hypothetical protein